MKKTFHYAEPDFPGNFLVGTNDNIKNGQHTIILLVGAGERKRGNFTTFKLALEAIDRRIMTMLIPVIDELEFNLIILCPEYEYTLAELRSVFKYSREVLGSKYESVLNHSLGGFGFNNQITAEIAEQTDGCCWVAPGPGYNKNAFSIIAKAGFVNWFITSNLDTVTAGDLGLVSETWDKAIGDAGGVSWLTLYDDTTISNEHSILATVLFKPWMWPAHGDTPKPVLDPIRWLLSNAYGLPAVAPDGEFSPVVPKQIPPVVIVPPVIIDAPPIIIEIPPVTLPPVELPEEKPAPVTIVWPEAEFSMSKTKAGEPVPLFKWSDGTYIDFSMKGEVINFINMKKYAAPRLPQGSVKYDSGKSKVIGPVKPV